MTGLLHGAPLRGAWLDSECMFCVLGRNDLFFHVKGNSDPEVVSCPALRACLRVLPNGEAYTVGTSVVFRAGGRTWKLNIMSTSPLYLAGCFSRSGVA